ncbi:AMP-binding protein, partial [bacterium]|nr:AMP-binding protein [bacterium]
METSGKLTLRELFKNSVREYHNRPALATVDGYAITYAEMEQNVQNISAYLREQGIIMGDRVAILSENMPNWGIAYFAITTIGAVAVPLLPDFHPNEVHHIVRNSKCKAIFVSQRFNEKIEDFQSDDLDIIVQLDDFSIIYENDPGNKLKEVIQEGRREFAKIYERALKRLGRLPEDVEEDSLAAIIYTSGTTGHSKGVMLTHKNVVWDAHACLELQHVTQEDRFLSLLPLSHTMESTVGFLVPLLKGASIHYFNRPPAPVLLIAAMKKIHPTMIVAVPLIIEKIYKKRILPELTKNRVFRSLYKFPPTRKKMNQAAGKKLLETFGGELKFFGV